MEYYKLEISKSVERDLKHIDKQYVPKIISSLRSLTQNPFPKNRFKKLKGSENCYKLRVGNYRILYEVRETIRLIHVYKVRHRKDVYK